MPAQHETSVEPSPVRTRLPVPTSIRVGSAVVLGTLFIMGPALLNGYPLVTPDSMGYITDGRIIVSAILHPLHHQVPDMRAEFYALGIFLLHWGHWLWPIVVFNALLTSVVLWCLVKHEVRSRPVTAFLAIVGFLAFMTGLSWSASSVLADAYGALAYVALYLLIFRLANLSVTERCLLVFTAWWGMVAHMSHLLIALGLCALLLLLSVSPWRAFATRRRRILGATAVVALAAFSQIAFHRFLYGKASLSGRSAPYLMARAIADGPAATYLQQHCSQLDWVICQHAGSLPKTENDFLFIRGGVWDGASPAEKEELRKEEIPLVLATLRTYPKEQLRRSWQNFEQQLTAIALYESSAQSSWLTDAVVSVTHGSGTQYLRSHQAHGNLPVRQATDLQDSVCLFSLLALVVLLPVAWVRHRRSKLPLAVVIVAALLINALVCGVISGVFMRYQSRVIWLLPLLAILLAMDLFQLRPAGPTVPEPLTP